MLSALPKGAQHLVGQSRFITAFEMRHAKQIPFTIPPYYFSPLTACKMTSTLMTQNQGAYKHKPSVFSFREDSDK